MRIEFKYVFLKLMKRACQVLNYKRMINC